MLTGILGTTLQCGFIALFGLVIGCYIEYRLTLMDFFFVPFIVLAEVVRASIVNGPNKRGFQGNIEAGGILSECVINIKTIFSFNFQKAALIYIIYIFSNFCLGIFY